MTLFEFFGGHITLGWLIALVIVAIFHKSHNSWLMSIILYFVLCFGFWIIGDWIWGGKELPSIHELPKY